MNRESIKHAIREAFAAEIDNLHRLSAEPRTNNEISERRWLWRHHDVIQKWCEIACAAVDEVGNDAR